MPEMTIEERVADQAKALQDAAAKLKLTVTADACLIAASNLAAAETVKAKK